MKCREAQYWLYSFQPNAAWPSDVVGHLQECPECQRLQAHLRQIDQTVNKVTTLPKNEAPVAQLLRRIEDTPQAQVEQPTPKPIGSWVRVGAYLSGIAALIALGVFIGRFLGGSGEPTEKVQYVEVVREKPVEVERIVRVPIEVEVFRDRIVEKIVPVTSSPDRSLFAALLKRNAELVQATPMDRLDTLLDMADDCRQHALTLIDVGPRDTLPMTIDLYAQLLRDGVLVQLAQAPLSARPARQTLVRTRLQKMDDVEAPKMTLTALVDQFNVLQKATRQTLARVDRLDDVTPPKAGKKRNEPIPPATALVQFAITFSAETDPVVKADFCADYVQKLTPALMLCLADDGMPDRDEMGQQFGEMIQFGIYQPLEKAPAKADADRIVQNANQTVAAMEKHLKDAPAGMKTGIQSAIDASQKKKGKGADKKGKAKGKGPQGKAETEHGKGPREIHGVLKRVDLANQTITLSARINGKDGDVTYPVTKALHSSLATRLGQAGGLQASMDLRLRLSEDRRTVIDIHHGRNEQGEKQNKR